MPLATVLREGFAPFVDLLFPPRCPLCGDGIAEQNGLCAPCWLTLEIPGGPVCDTCQAPLREGEAQRCAHCTARSPRHDGVYAGTVYTDAARTLVLRYKHGRKIAMAPLLARLMAARLPVMEEEWLLVPVPLHWTRQWQRGFNQSALLAKSLGRLLGQPVLVDGLKRTKRTKSLGGMGGKARKSALQGAIAGNPRRANALAGARVLLVDDVLTSGATSAACVDALKAAGATQVRIACFARVL
ncbi:MAG: ComF family protein [Parerythrobacter sp.]